MEQFDVVIIGAGPTGLACAIEVQKQGLRAVLVEKGCVVNSIYNYPTNMTFFTTPELLEIGDLPMTSIGDKPGRTEALKYYRRVADHYALDIRQYQLVTGMEGHDGAFVVRAVDQKNCPHSYAAKKVIIATGYYDRPNLLNVPGEDLAKVIHYYKEAHPYYNHDVIVVGAKNSAAIAALELFWNGARVTMVHRGPGISSKVKYWIKPNIENRIKSGEIKAFFNTQILEITQDAVRMMTPDGEVTVKNDFVLAMTGYRPDLEFLEQNGVFVDHENGRPRTDKNTFETDRKGLYLAGCIVAGMHTNEIFIENGRFHGKAIADSIKRSLA
jgi:thioredoxin reductase (NADPH)